MVEAPLVSLPRPAKDVPGTSRPIRPVFVPELLRIVEGIREPPAPPDQASTVRRTARFDLD